MRYIVSHSVRSVDPLHPGKPEPRIVLREEAATAKAARTRNRLYDEAVRQALTVLWEAADRVCGKRLKALIPMLVDAMERHGHLDLDPVIKTKVLQVSAATIDRVLAAARFFRRLARSATGLLRDRHGRTLRRREDRR